MYNYGSFDTMSNILKIDIQISVEKYKDARFNYRSNKNCKNMALVAKTALCVAAYFVKFLLCSLALATISTIGKCFKAEMDNDPDLDLILVGKMTQLAALKLQNFNITQATKNLWNTAVSLFA